MLDDDYTARGEVALNLLLAVAMMVMMMMTLKLLPLCVVPG